MAEEETKNEEVLNEFAAMSEPSSAEDSPETGEREWMNTLDMAASEPTTPNRENFDDFLRNFTSFSEISAEPSAQSSGTGLTGLLGNPVSDDSDALFENAAPADPDVADIDPEDPLAWMRAGVGDDSAFSLPEDDQMPDLDALLSDTSAGDALPLIDDEISLIADESGPYEWMKDHGIELEEPAASQQDEEHPAGTNETDPFAWMHEHDIELNDAPKEASLWDDPMGVDQMGSLDENEVDPMGWMQGAGVEVEPEADADPMAWARELGVDVLDESEAPTPSTIATATLPSDPAVTGSQTGKPLASEETARDQQPPAEEKPSGLLAFLKNENAAQSGGNPMSENELPDWLSEPDDEEKKVKPDADSGDLADFDWMAVKPVDSGAEIDWDAPPDEAEALDEATPDWLASLDNPVDAAAAAALSAKDDPAVKDLWEDVSDDLSADAPDWMAALRDDPASEVPAADEAAEWLFEQAEPAKDEIADAAADLLAAGTNETAAGDSFDWMAAVEAEATDTDAAPAEPMTAENALDWLDAAAPDAAADDVPAAETPDWLSASEPAADAEADADMSWLSAAAPDESEVVQPAATGMDWLSMSTEEEIDDIGEMTNAFVAQDSLDWLTGGADENAANADENPADTGSDFGVPGSADDEFAESAESEGGAPSYELSFLEDEAPTEDIATVELEGDPLPDWLVESRADAASKLDVDVPEGQLNVQGELAGEILDDADLLEAEPPVQESLNASAVNSPDWLNAMVPGLEIGSDVLDDEEPAAENEFLNGGRSDYGWLTNIVDQELAPPSLAAPSRRSSRYPFGEPPGWLAMLRDETQGAAPVLDFDADDESLPDWLKFDDAETN